MPRDEASAPPDAVREEADRSKRPASRAGTERAVETVAQLAESQAQADEPDGLGRFVHLYLAQLAPDYLIQAGPARLTVAIRRHWELTWTRPPNTPLVRVSNPPDGATAHTVVEVVTDDMAFLVDSVAMEVERQGFAVHELAHPLIAVERDAGRLVRVVGSPDRTAADATDGTIVESYIRLEIDRETDGEILERLERDLTRVLGDVRAATRDWAAMRDAVSQVVDHIEANPPPVEQAETDETVSLLRWMLDDNFTFLGAAEYDLRGERGDERLEVRAETQLGILHGRERPASSDSFARLPPDIRSLAYEPTLLTLTKANSRATVHRSTYLDYVGIKRFETDGTITGEWRFLGLWTWSAYHASVEEVPVVRRKAAQVSARAGFPARSHSARDLAQTLETLPRDELFATPVDELYELASGVLHLQMRKRTRLFARRDQFRRFVSCLVFLPRDRYNTAARARITEILVGAFSAISFEFDALVAESRLARLHFVLRTDPADEREVDVGRVEAAIADATRTWSDELREALVSAHGEEGGLDRFKIWSNAFPSAFQDDYPATAALGAMEEIQALGPERSWRVRLSDPATTSAGDLDFTVFVTGEAPKLSEVLPILGHMGVEVVDEHPYLVRDPGGHDVLVQRFGLRTKIATGDPQVRREFESCFRAVVEGRAENDGLNELVLSASLTWRQVSLLRSYSRYLRQVGTRFGQGYIAEAVSSHPGIARDLVRLYTVRFHPEVADDERQHRSTEMADGVTAALDAVESLDEDRILRSLLELVEATVRTSTFARPDAAALAIKLDPSRVSGLPEPRPKHETWVYSPTVEGIHLRSDDIARGGIRWSDRPADFRTEVLGLMKAQRVKNTVIVPSGAKGGFVVKRAGVHSVRTDRDDVVAAYRAYIEALLDMTDNRVDGTVTTIDDMVRYDGDDVYIVAAADKGTATFSDTANAIALARDFWLGDAFASGGSVGYDHKKMGITARGAWESVRRHFRELGVDADDAPLTAVGIGDMSGDVFGNGMLQSRQLRLVAAFDHRHIFLDPDPDPAASYEERLRLFRLPRSSWADYDAQLISSGGGVHSRAEKSIPVTPEVRERLALPESASALTPAEMIRAILRAPVDLVWNGGVGTYVKASEERHGDVGDKANDLLRVDADELRCRVVCEGGNLGLTQRARVEFAQHGGAVNTDFVDNSGGVDASDHEVNIKIALDSAVRADRLTIEERNEVFLAMTDDVAGLVLRTNYRQNRALANARAQAFEMSDVHTRYMRDLEQDGLLDRAVEFLPDDEVLIDRHQEQQGLTGPELAVLLSYAKISLETRIRSSELPDDSDFADELVDYFPERMHERFGSEIAHHPLRRAIVSTQVANRLVNLAGISFVFRMQEETGASVADIVRAHRVARELFDVSDAWRRIEALDCVVDAGVQTDMYLHTRRAAERASRWLLRHRRRPLPVRSTLDFFGPGIRTLGAELRSLVRDAARTEMDNHAAELAKQGVPSDLADTIADMDPLIRALDIVDLALRAGLDVERVAGVHFELGDRLNIDWLTQRVLALPRDDRWHSMARTALRDDTSAVHRELTAEVLSHTQVLRDPVEACDDWLGANAELADRSMHVLSEIRAQEAKDLHTLTVALRELRNLAQPR